MRWYHKVWLVVFSTTLVAVFFMGARDYLQSNSPASNKSQAAASQKSFPALAEKRFDEVKVGDFILIQGRDGKTPCSHLVVDKQGDDWLVSYSPYSRQLIKVLSRQWLAENQRMWTRSGPNDDYDIYHSNYEWSLKYFMSQMPDSPACH